MRWPWQRRETRADSSYTDALIQVLLAQATGETTAFPGATAALEACAGMVGRAFASARVEGAQRALEVLTPAVLAMIGRALIRRGEILFAIDVVDGQLRLVPVASHDVLGDYDRWTYRINLAGPGSQAQRNRVPAEAVVHLTYAVDPETPWRGYGPLQVARLAGRLSAETVAALADESSGPRGSFLPLPRTDGQDGTITNLKADIRKAKGSLLAVEGMGDQWQTDQSRNNSGWEQKRFGASPPDAMVSLAAHASNEVFAACGLSPSLFIEGGDGTAQREGWRRALFGVIAPLGRTVEAELREKLDTPDLVLVWDELRASDLAGRARAFQSMIGGGMDVAKAAALAGLTEPE